MIGFNTKENEILLAAMIQPDSIVDGPGIRTVIWTQGCTHNCKECHNPETHSINAGGYVSIDNICNQIKDNNQNITFSGGDPMLQPKQCAKIARCAKERRLTVWAYTGFKFEYLISLNNKDINEFLKFIDVLVDGPFDVSKKSYECLYRGSTNQRLIDVQQSLSKNTVTEWVNPYSTLATPSSSGLF
jgi:anaerobic ribonucleoside-triphosphate reductase activating protein